jgi:hypothetical protein
MIKTRLFPLLGALVTCTGATVPAQAANDPAQKQQELTEAVQRQVLTLNVNQVSKYVIDFNFSTFQGMYAYRELLLWAQAAPQPQRGEVMALTRAGLEAVVRHSGMGIPLGMGEEQAVGLLFSRGLPRYVAQPDFAQPATLKWDAASFDRQIAPESVGQSLAAKSLYVLTDSSDDGKKLREVLLASALHEFRTLVPLLELGGDKGASYMPALLKLDNDKWSVVNASSQLYGQMSLIQGLTHLHAALSLAALENETVGGKRVAEWRKEVRRTLERVYQTAIKLHLDVRTGSLVSSYERLKGASERLGAEDAGYALEVLADLADTLQKGDPLREAVLKQLTAQADYIVAARPEGKATAPKTFLIKNNQTFAGTLLQLENQLAIVNGLLAAEQATGRERYGKAALAIFDAAHEGLWCAPAGIFRAAAGFSVTAYDGRLFGLTLATWRRLEKSRPPGEARQHGERLIEAVLKHGGLQQAEGPAAGEPKQPEAFIRDDLPELVSSIVALKKAEQLDKIAAAIKTLSDQNGDGVPGCRFAGGRFGAAPVLIIQTSVKTPFATPPVAANPPTAATPPRSTP